MLEACPVALRLLAAQNFQKFSSELFFRTLVTISSKVIETGSSLLMIWVNGERKMISFLGLQIHRLIRKSNTFDRTQRNI